MSENNKRVRFDDLEEKPPQKKKFNLFDILYSRSREKAADDTPWHERTLKYFFPFMVNNFGRIFNLNLLFVLGNFPVFLFLLVFSENLHLQAIAPASPLFAPVYGALQCGVVSPTASLFCGTYGATVNVAIWTPLAVGVLIAAIVLILITFGPTMTGVTFVMRNIVKGEPIFMWNDFTYAIKRNFRQSLLLGITDLVINALLIFDIVFFYTEGIAYSGAMLVVSVVLFIIYGIMRYYMYILMVTFKLSLAKIMKNSFIFAAVNVKRNLMALLGIITVIFLNYCILMILLPIGVVLPFILTVGLCMFISVYAAWPKIKQIMIDPYYKDDNGNKAGDKDGGEDYSAIMGS